MTGQIACTYQNHSIEDLAVKRDQFTHNSNISHQTVVLFGPPIETGSVKGRLEHNSKEVSVGNENYNKEGSRVALELNMDSNPKTLTFFYNDVKQPHYIINIPPAVRFWAYLTGRGISFKVNKFERLSEATAKHLEGKSQALTWGKDWKKKCVIQ
ncbi:MAG: hypothetical protein EZS28_009050 [Streblomastix strix]|uniref:Uncharacterized protein n=1 Tax=Streblomastix strix TaxID=222440 RepID=A0A5J4WKF3_9EUKA|nr:MAG: hypothetical protein EZS28_009050 [Streblomastix strix]